MRRAAERVLTRHDLGPHTLQLVVHSFNTTFRVRTEDGATYALRVSPVVRRSPAHLLAESSWLAALSSQTDLLVPAPQPDRDGELVTWVDVPELGGERPAVLMSWLPGRILGRAVPRAALRELGRATAVLHEHAASWKLPAGARLDAYTDPLFTDTDTLRGHPSLTAEEHEVVEAVRERSQAAFDRLGGQDLRPLHADLHQWNLRWAGGRLAVFDFDDSALGHPALDLAISAYYLRRIGHGLHHVLDGYATVASPPDVDPADLEALVAGRNLLLLNDILVDANAQAQAMVPRYLRESLHKLRAYLDTGRYAHDVPGLESS